MDINHLLLLAGLTVLQSSGIAYAQQEARQEARQENLLPGNTSPSARVKWINTAGSNLQTRILPPAGYERTTVPSLSFAYYLRMLPLKPHGYPVLYHHGAPKNNSGVYEAVVLMEIGKKDLQQCADAVIRLRAEYLWREKQYERISFTLTNGFKVAYSEWIKGKRVAVAGNKTWWKQTAQPGNTYESFRKYLDFVFAYAGTLSLAKELKPVLVQQLEIGDVFIQGGSPGHAVIVVDKAIQPHTGRVLFLLAQSYMPAQDIQILQNPVDRNLSPWYAADFGQTLHTPEWTFRAADLRRFAE